MPKSTPEEMTGRTMKGVAVKTGAAVLVTAGSLVFALAMAELALRFLVKPPDTYSMLTPGIRVFDPDPRYISGVAGPAHYEVNAAGYRGAPFGTDASEYRILLVGGSTTECTL